MACTGRIIGQAMAGLTGPEITPLNSGSYYYNYKNTFSIVIMVLVDASYRFIYMDIGCNGCISDGGVFNPLHANDAYMRR